MSVNVAIGFGGILLLGVIGFVYAWIAIDREKRQRSRDEGR